MMRKCQVRFFGEEDRAIYASLPDQLKDEVPDPPSRVRQFPTEGNPPAGLDSQPTKKVIGVDFGRRDIAATSNGEEWSAKQLTKTRDRYSLTRASLQRKASTRTHI